MWTVVVEEHEIIGTRVRYLVARRTARIGGHTHAATAKRRVLQWAHSDAGVPPWRPFLRQSWPSVSASEYVEIVQ